jgi:hypothetical protein
MNTQTEKKADPLFAFDAYLRRDTVDGEFVAWEFVVNKTIFPVPTDNFENGVSYDFTLDSDKYSKSFAPYKKMFNVETLPENMYKYSLKIDGDFLYISGISETTVRVAVTDTVTKQIPDTKLKLVRPPVNFRVYKEDEVVDEVDLGNMFLFGGAEDGDY